MAGILKYDFEPHTLALSTKSEVVSVLGRIMIASEATQLIEDNPDLLVLKVTEEGSWIKRLRSVLYKSRTMKISDGDAELLGYMILGIKTSLYYRFSNKIPTISFDEFRSCWRDYTHECNKVAKAFFSEAAGGLSLLLYKDEEACEAKDDTRSLGRAFIWPRRSGVLTFNIKTTGNDNTVKWDSHIKPILLNHLPTPVKIEKTSAYIDINGTYADYAYMWQIFTRKTAYPCTMELNKYVNP